MRPEVTQPAQRASRKRLMNIFTRKVTENNVSQTSFLLLSHFASEFEDETRGITIRVIITCFPYSPFGHEYSIITRQL